MPICQRSRHLTERQWCFTLIWYNLVKNEQRKQSGDDFQDPIFSSVLCGTWQCFVHPWSRVNPSQTTWIGWFQYELDTPKPLVSQNRAPQNRWFPNENRLAITPVFSILDLSRSPFFEAHGTAVISFDCAPLFLSSTLVPGAAPKSLEQNIMCWEALK